MLAGLEWLHAQGVCHRDIKGANLLITKDGQVKLADFGVAGRVDASAKPAAEQAGAPVGTPYWMAPEIIQMEPFTTASDIWSLGCTVLELLTGEPPYFELRPVNALYRIVHNTDPPIPETADIAEIQPRASREMALSPVPETVHSGCSTTVCSRNE